MHCYEYLAMHLLLKSELKRLFPNCSWNNHDVEEAFSRMNINSIKDLENLEPKLYIKKLGVQLKQPRPHRLFRGRFLKSNNRFRTTGLQA